MPEICRQMQVWIQPRDMEEGMGMADAHVAPEVSCSLVSS